jgi:16S rRNA (adenine1518-N6/adenine1519-N6)-dimethyltransferase
MNLHEYQGKSILKSYGVAVQEGVVVDKVEDAVAAAKKLTEETVIERDRFFLHRGDILKGKNQIQPQVTEKLTEITSMPGISGYKLVANLPYAVATPVISNLLISRHPPTKIVAMVQLEIAEKIISKPKSKEFGSLPILFQSLAKVEIVRRISPAAFWPRPKVDSAIIKIA